VTSFVKRTLKKQKNNPQPDSVISRDKVIERHISCKEVSLPPLRKTITVVTERDGGYEPFVICFEELISEFIELEGLVKEFQAGIELWSKNISIYTLKGMSICLYLVIFFEFVRVIRESRKVEHISDITPNIMQNFKSFLETTNRNSIKIKCYQYVRLFIKTVQQSKFAELAVIGPWQGKFPSGFPREYTPKEGLSEKIFSDLVTVLKENFDIAKNNLRIRKRVLSRPVFIGDLNANRWTLNNALWFYRHKYLDEKECRKKWHCKSVIEKNGYSVDELEEIYDGSFPKDIDKAEDPTKKIGICSLSNDVRVSIAISEIANNYPEYPFDMSILEASLFLTYSGYVKPTVKYPERGLYINHSSKKLYSLIKAIRPPFPGPGFGGVNAVNSYFYPNMKIIGTCFIIVQMESGWNQQTLLDFKFGETFESSFHKDILCENHRVMVSSKYRTNKEVFFRTYTKNRYGTYQVLRFLWEFGRVMRERAGSKSPWFFISSYFLKTDGPISKLSIYNLHNATRSICNGFSVETEEGGVLRQFGSDRLRQNYADNLDELVENDSEKISNGLQNKISTTEKHYRNKQRQKKRLSKEQEDWVENFTFFQGAFQPAREVDMSVLNIPGKPVAQIITTNGVEPVLICGNPFKPDWMNWQYSLKEGQRCGFFNGCATCSQVNIFSETLPYIFVRIRDIDRFQTKLSRPEWENIYNHERSAWQEVIDEWPLSEEVEGARISSEKMVLPNRPVFNK